MHAPNSPDYRDAMQALKAALDWRDRHRADREAAAYVSLDTHRHQRPRSSSPRAVLDPPPRLRRVAAAE